MMIYRNFSYILIIVISSVFSVHRSWIMEEKEEKATQKLSEDQTKNLPTPLTNQKISKYEGY
jgi:hypothetical protein